MVSTTTIAAMIISLMMAVGTPILLLIIFKKKFHISIKVLLFGMLTFFVFAFVLEQIIHTIVFMSEPTKSLLDNAWLYMLYGGLMAGIFEETGRFIMMKYALKKHREWKDGLSFGLGHGGIEAFLLVGINSVVMIVFALMINNGTFDALMIGAAEEAMAPIKEQLTEGSAFLILFGGVERLGALAIHIGLSIFVLYGIMKGRNIYLVYAILIHALVDFPVALYQKGMFSLYGVEIYLLLIAIGFVVWIIKSKALFSRET